MPDESLTPQFRQLAEQRLGQPLTPELERWLLQQIRQQPASPDATPGAPRAANAAAPGANNRQAVRQQMRHFLQLNQQRAYENMRGILQTIDTQNATTQRLLENEQQKVAGMVDAGEPAAAPPPADGAATQDATRQALEAIAEHLADLIRQEVERSFVIHLAPLAQQVNEIHAWLAALGAQAATVAAPAPAEPSPAVHAPPDEASLE
ncbi:hypothetical protein Bsp3421_004221 [Burkholderia sp. FERM BP-3421]|uniref:hypothetical protein n=1 Tax=Burkholderia sp. FERM BP-3421 TaxID=1494466 RepID=UPI00235F60F4|nr:hypothetical protein [Burkholderia sp. FERM BP-3421]WDD94113.1 hypothetical protein Bsp3421_004221 [Burkholderia sp. FERM BP-3421]